MEIAFRNADTGQNVEYLNDDGDEGGGEGEGNRHIVHGGEGQNVHGEDGTPRPAFPRETSGAKIAKALLTLLAFNFPYGRWREDRRERVSQTRFPISACPYYSAPPPPPDPSHRRQGVQRTCGIDNKLPAYVHSGTVF